MQRATLPHSLLVREPDKTSASGRAGVRLSTIGESCRAFLRESVRGMTGWIVEQLESARSSGRSVTKRLDAILHRPGLGSISSR